MHDGTTRFRKGDAGSLPLPPGWAFAEKAVLPERSVIPIRKDAPLDVVCLVSCGVTAGAGPSSTRPSRRRARRWPSSAAAASG